MINVSEIAFTSKNTVLDHDSTTTIEKTVRGGKKLIFEQVSSPRKEGRGGTLTPPRSFMGAGLHLVIIRCSRKVQRALFLGLLMTIP